MKFNPQKFALAASATVGVWAIFCTIFAALWPGLAMRLFGWIIHLVSVEKYINDVGVTPKGAIIGFVQVIVYSYVTAFIFAWLYNKLTVEDGKIK